MPRLIPLLSLLALSALPACGRNTTTVESETHFLAECASSCAEGLECICGVCTVACDESEDACEDLNGACQAVDDSCSGASSATVCDVGCTSASDCSGLGNDATCQDGRCRIEHMSGGGSGGSGGTAGNGGAGNGGTAGGPVSCEAYDDPSEPDPVTLKVVNRRSSTVVLGAPSSCQTDNLTITSLNETTPGSWSGSGCNFTCGQRDQQVGCPAICALPTPVVLEPDEEAELEWVGFVLHTVSLPAECCDNPSECPCSLLQVAADGAYRATLAYLDVTEEQAATCEGDAPFECPAITGTAELTLLDVDFTLGSGEIVLEIPDSGSGEPPLSCQDLEDEVPPPVAFTLTVMNSLDTPIVLGGRGDCQFAHFTVTSQNDESPGSWSGNHCQATCSASVQGYPTCDASCPIATPIALLPGESADVDWGGVVAQTVDLAAECCENADGECPTECDKIRVARPGAYSVEIPYVQATEEEAAACNSDPFDCPVHPATGTVDLQTAEIDFELDTDDVLEITEP